MYYQNNGYQPYNYNSAQPTGYFNTNGYQSNVPMQQQMQQAQQQNTGVIRVNGIEGAQAYQTEPNSSIVLVDIQNPIVYFKNTNGAGFATISAYSISEIKMDGSGNPDYVTRDEYNKLVALVEELKGGADNA